MEEITIRLMTRQDFPFIDSLRSLAGWNQTLQDWQRMLDSQPDGCYLACIQDLPVATLTTTCFQDRLAWIGMVLTHPDFRRRGIAGKLMEHALQFLQNRQITCVKLDATPQGKPLYEQLGFHQEYNLHRWKASAWIPLPHGEFSGSVRTPSQEDWDQILMLDGEAFDTSRRDFLQMLSRQSEKTLVVSDKHNAVRGFGMIRPGMIADYLGPLMARSPDAIPPLVSALTENKTGRPIFWDIPDFQTETISLAQQHGLQPLRELMRMYWKSNPLPGNPNLLFGISDPATG